MTTIGDLVIDAQVGFACGKEDPDGVFQFRMNNVSKDSTLDLDKRRRVPPDANRQLPNYLVEPGDVLFNATNSPDNVGKSILVPEIDEPAVFSNHFIRLRVDNQRLDSAFLWRWLQWQFQRGTFHSMCRQWVNQATVSRESLLRLTIDVPLPDEQRRIAAILDRADALRTKRRQVEALLNDLSLSMFVAMFGDPIYNPGGYECMPLANLLTGIDSGTSPVCEARPAADDEWAILKLGAVSYGVFNPADNKAFLGNVTSLRQAEVRPGDFLFSRKNTKELVGATAIVHDTPPRRLLPDLVFRLSLDTRRIDPEYLQSLLRHPRKRQQVVALASGSASSMANISQARLRTLNIELPPIERQREYANRVRAVRSIAALGQSDLSSLDELFASIQYRAFRGDL
ncbi:restriction endonuclease subunit S [Mycolicibacterium fortuitum]|uniref:restriction endonuclease subunit S n=1 Tax=Mycolicibacterium fortuitum TaxID=1766 RepID=UPI001CDCEA51|nr:restriction endonuclease subunit S [Mycolicibacterium fortuitum]UBV13915.1 restriction endonuclease subunit S [Mycolicibacterium fortuitum]